MKLNSIRASHYRSLLNLDLDVRQLNLLIGANASGKSNILDALRFLSEGVRDRDFSPAVSSRGGLIQLGWKGEEAGGFELAASFESGGHKLLWCVRVIRRGQRDFSLEEELHRENPKDAPGQLLAARDGKGTWYSEGGRQVHFSLTEPTGCALAAAAADESFPGKAIAKFVGQWGFFDPSPGYLRLPAVPAYDGAQLDTLGRNLAARLYEINETRHDLFVRIVEAVRSLLGVPDKIEPRVSDDGSVYFVLSEQGMKFPVHQKGASAGTLRMLALTTALIGEAGSSLVGIEEPENYVHPNALAAFAVMIREASERVQLLLTTHSPLFLNYMDTPEAVCVVKRGTQGTYVQRETSPHAVRKALEESGFGLGDFYETKGFGK